MLIIPVGNNIEKNDIPFVTFGLMAANIIVFLHQLSNFANAATTEAAWQGEDAFYMQFGLIPSELFELQVIGLVTHMFVHAGLMHLVGNMLTLYVFGPAIEYGLGRWTMLAFYGLFGLAGGITHACMDMESIVPLVGASGAIAGLMGAYTVVYGPASKIRMMLLLGLQPIFFYVPAALFGAVWILLQLSNASEDAIGGGVAWWAHVGGFATGAVVAWICRNELEGELSAGTGDKMRMLSPEEIAQEEAREAEIKERKALGLSSIIVPLSEAELAPPPTVCEYCGAELLEENKIGDQLYRCQCQRMVYLSVQQAEAIAAANREPQGV